MEIINKIEEFDGFLKACMKKGIYTNCHGRPKDLERLICDGKIQLNTIGENTLVLVNYLEYYRLHFAIKAFGNGVFDQDEGENQNKVFSELELGFAQTIWSAFEIKKDIPIVTEMVYTQNKKVPKEVFDYFKENGFSEYVNRLRFAVVAENMCLSKSEFEHKVEFGKLDEISQIRELILDNFEPYTSCIPTLDELKSIIENKNILCARDEKQALLGIIHFEKRGNVVLILHVVVKNEARGKKIADNLLLACKEHNKENEKTAFKVWTMVDNEKAKNLYEKAGFVPDGYYSKALIN